VYLVYSDPKPSVFGPSILVWRY